MVRHEAVLEAFETFRSNQSTFNPPSSKPFCWHWGSPVFPDSSFRFIQRRPTLVKASMASKLFLRFQSPPQVGGLAKRLTNTLKTHAGSSTNLPASIGTTEDNSGDGTGHTSSGGQPPPSKPPTVNVVLFGETGVGKSSVINLIARRELAKVSSDVNGCTMQSTRHDIPFDNMNFAIFDTIGLEEPQMGVNGYLKAIEKAYELIVELGAAGGIHLLLFCMRGGRITATTQSNYRLFCECLCSTKVPIALVFTGLEREVEMEDWWKRNQTHIEHYGIRSNGHACITAVRDDTPGEDLKYTESQTRIRELLKTCALRNDAFKPEPHTWLGWVGKGLRSFIEKSRNPKKKDVMRVLTRRCKLDPETARKIADMMEQGDAGTKEETPDKQKGDTETKEETPDKQKGNTGTKEETPDRQKGDIGMKEENLEMQARGSEGTKPGPESRPKASRGKPEATEGSVNGNVAESDNRSVQEGHGAGGWQIVEKKDSPQSQVNRNGRGQPRGLGVAEITNERDAWESEASDYHSTSGQVS